MELTWFQSILYGLFSGLAEVFPISAPAHRIILLKVFGEGSESPLLRLMLHIGTLAALYYASHTQILRFIRARRLAAIPKRRRKRPLDTTSLTDLRILRMTLLPIIVGFLFYSKVSGLSAKLLAMAGLLLVNGLILFLPQYLPGSNKKSETMSRADGLLIGIGGGLSVLPGISGVGAATSIGLVCGVDQQYALNLSLLMSLPISIGLILFDILAIAASGVGALSFGLFVRYLLAAGAGFGGSYLAIRAMRALATNSGFALFAYYNWGLALLSVILYITV